MNETYSKEGLALKPPTPFQFQQQRLIIQGVDSQRGGRLLLRDFNLELTSGGVIELTGANGTGKTTLLRLIAGLATPDSGHIWLVGEGYPQEASIAERCHFIGSQDALTAELNPREHLAFWQDLCGGSPGLDHEAVLQQTGIAHIDHVPAGYLSAGQRRRLCLGRLLVTPRPLWLLDEPMNALDASGRVLLRRLIEGHRQAGGIAVAATHEPLQIADTSEVALGAQRVELVL